jgi:polar amino acid transport system substrate-binding protein
MGQRSAIALLSCLVAVLSTVPGWAETVLERVARTGVLTAGTQPDSVPFNFVDQQGNWAGYSVDLMGLIRDRLEHQLGKPIQLNFVEVTPENRISQVANGNLDIVCSTTSFTSGRNLDASFSVGYFITGTQLLVDLRRNLGDEFNIGVIPGTTNQQSIRRRLPLAEFVNVDNRRAGLRALERGQIDALASDGVLLQGLRQTARNPSNFEVLPAQPYSQETYACVLPQGDSRFQALVNESLIGFMQGVLNNDPRNMAIFNTWFGATGVVPVDREQVLHYFRQTVDSYAQNLGRVPSP